MGQHLSRSCGIHSMPQAYGLVAPRKRVRAYEDGRYDARRRPSCCSVPRAIAEKNDKEPSFCATAIAASQRRDSLNTACTICLHHMIAPSSVLNWIRHKVMVRRPLNSCCCATQYDPRHVLAARKHRAQTNGMRSILLHTHAPSFWRASSSQPHALQQ